MMTDPYNDTANSKDIFNEDIAAMDRQIREDVASNSVNNQTFE